MACSRCADPRRAAARRAPAGALLALAIAQGCATAAAVRHDTRAQQPAIEQAINEASPAAVDAQMNRRFFAMMLRDAQLDEGAGAAASAGSAAAAAPADEQTLAALQTSFESRLGLTPVEVLREGQRRAAARVAEKDAFELLAAAFGGEESEGATSDPLEEVMARSTALLQRRVQAVAGPVVAASERDDVLVVVAPGAGASARAVLTVDDEVEPDEGAGPTPLAAHVLRGLSRASSEPRAALGIGVRAVVAVGPEMVLITANDDQLACLVGHELAHVDLGHPRVSVWRGASQLVAGVAGASAVGAIPFAGPLLSRLLPTEDVLGEALLGAPLRVAGHERTQEFDADRRGQELAARAGYEPAACAELVLETARHASAASAAGDATASAPAYWATHPPSIERILALRESAESLPRPVATAAARRSVKDGAATPGAP